MKVIPGQKPVRENRNGLNISILDWVFFGRQNVSFNPIKCPLKMAAIASVRCHF
ncbi:hypothetical protein VCRA2123O159_120152 [Vibrio crassostreae]|nr:hypothetical protein VCRA2113O138_120154 [Vibrio crassostreae]CAK2595165.1 hypothetical protein VCRA2119O148_120002 [Vibrio crassostreae]CAK2627036.1 hypothetical protein VCRA2121O154_130151 [Vibrio crassostreae]CAK2629415.1 hypothetical protein VCRA2113O139_130149 [Vibrio crassostreae]CAK3202887.1 hypothetical protein VCRA2121O152_130150 [Vibrio crassostreae]